MRLFVSHSYLMVTVACNPGGGVESSQIKCSRFERRALLVFSCWLNPEHVSEYSHPLYQLSTSSQVIKATTDSRDVNEGIKPVGNALNVIQELEPLDQVLLQKCSGVVNKTELDHRCTDTDTLSLNVLLFMTGWVWIWGRRYTSL